MDYRTFGLLLLFVFVFADARSARRKRFASFPKFFGYANAVNNRQLNYYKPYGVRERTFGSGNSGSNGGVPNGGGNNNNDNNNDRGQNGGSPNAPRTRQASCDFVPNPTFAGFGAMRGKIDLSESEGAGITMAVSINGIQMSSHALAIRATGKMEGGCENAGGIYNPTGTRPIGDLGRLSANNPLEIKQTIATADNTLFGDTSIVGRVISVATSTDDAIITCCVVYRVD